MSKRYGRNQKRKHIEEIKALKVKIAINDNINGAMVNSIQEKLNRARYNIEEMVSMIEKACEYSSCLPAKTLRGDEISDTFCLPIGQQKPLLSPFISGADLLQRTRSESLVNLHALETYIDDHYESFCKCVHLQYNGNRRAYMISKDALLTTPTKKLSSYIVPNIANELIFCLKDNLKRGDLS